MDLSPGLGYGEPNLFSGDRASRWRIHALRCVFMDRRSIHNSLRIGNATGRSSFAEAKLP